MSASIAHSIGFVLARDARNRFESRRAWVGASSLAVLLTILLVPKGTIGFVASFGAALGSIVVLHIAVAEIILASAWLSLYIRPGITVISHDSHAALLAKRVERDGTTVLTAGAAAGQPGTFARFALIRAERATADGRLVVRVFSRIERDEVLHQLPGARALSRYELDVTQSWDMRSESLGRDALPLVVAEAVRSFASEWYLASGVIALTGPWGAGKSWVLDRLVEELECASPERIHVRTLRFNPWLYSDEGSLFAGFAQVLASEAPSRRARSRLLKALTVIGPAAKLGPVDLAGVVQKFTDIVGRGFEDASAVTVEVTKSIRRRGPLCIIIDDVDRLTTDELLTLFKLVRLLGNVPNLNYVLAFDEQLVLSLLARTSFAADNPVRARAFLEKIIERKISVPPLTAAQMRSRVIDPLIRYPLVRGLRVKEGSMDRMETMLSTLLVPEQVTIRSAERLIDVAQSLPEELYGEVDWGDWVIVAWVRVFAPALWIWITENRDELVGSPRRFSPLESRPPLDGVQVINQLGFVAPMRDLLQDVLEALFPIVGQVSKNVFIRRADEKDVLHRQGIGAKGYFDRYVWGTLPPGQLPDMRIVTELRRLSVDESGRLAGEVALKSFFQEDRSAVEQMIAANEGDSEIDWIAVLEFLCVDSSRSRIENGANRFFARATAVRAFYGLDNDGRERLMRQTNLDPPRWWDLLSDVRSTELPPELSEWASRLAELREKAIECLVASLASGGAPYFVDMERLQTFWDLRNIDLARANKLLVDQVDLGRWNLIDAIGSLVKVYGSTERIYFRGLPIDEVVAIFGPERLTELADSLERVTRTRDYWDQGGSFDPVPATESSLREIVAGGLLQWREYQVADPSDVWP